LSTKSDNSISRKYFLKPHFFSPSLCPLAPTEVEILFVFFSKTKRLERMAGTVLG
jgi:hypothetical protein